MDAVSMRRLFTTPKKRGRPRTKKYSKCKGLSFTECKKMTDCMGVYANVKGKHRQYCRTRHNKKRS